MSCDGSQTWLASICWDTVLVVQILTSFVKRKGNKDNEDHLWGDTVLMYKLIIRNVWQFIRKKFKKLSFYIHLYFPCHLQNQLKFVRPTVILCGGLSMRSNELSTSTNKLQSIKSISFDLNRIICTLLSSTALLTDQLTNRPKLPTNQPTNWLTSITYHPYHSCK